MKIIKKLTYIMMASSLAMTACEKTLDKPTLDEVVDKDGLFWRNETDLRFFSTGFYSQYFNGYNSAWGTDYTPVRGYTFSDDLTAQSLDLFLTDINSFSASTSETATWNYRYGGPFWNFSWVRKSLLFLNRIENYAKPNLTTEQYNHWTAVAKFFKASEYSRLVSSYGDVPYFDKEVSDNDFATQYKDRDDRGYVMDKVYEDFEYVLDNIRVDDGANVLNKNIAAAFISRVMLFEGSWQKYHNLDQDRAKKYLTLAVRASEIVMNSNKYKFTSDFKGLFTSEDLNNNEEVIMYRKYNSAVTVTHAIGSYHNGNEAQLSAPSLKLLKEFLVNDGKPYTLSSNPLKDNFVLDSLAKSRDPRFEASFASKPNTGASTLVYGNKFSSRYGYLLTNAKDAEYTKWNSNTNTSDAPVIRYAEVVLNWIEAKAILAESFGGAAVTQADIDKSINAIRTRPLDKDAEAKGVKKTFPYILGSVSDPNKDTDVTDLMWEIRRERRMEFVFEFSRLNDLRRWKKLDKMVYEDDSDNFKGVWVDLNVVAPSFLDVDDKGKPKKNVVIYKQDGTKVVYDGSNKAEMVGYYGIYVTRKRPALDEKYYLAPLPQSQISDYETRGYKLTQTKGW